MRIEQLVAGGAFRPHPVLGRPLAGAGGRRQLGLDVGGVGRRRRDGRAQQRLAHQLAAQDVGGLVGVGLRGQQAALGQQTGALILRKVHPLPAAGGGARRSRHAVEGVQRIAQHRERCRQQRLQLAVALGASTYSTKRRLSSARRRLDGRVPHGSGNSWGSFSAPPSSCSDSHWRVKAGQRAGEPGVLHQAGRLRRGHLSADAQLALLGGVEQRIVGHGAQQEVRQPRGQRPGDRPAPPGRAALAGTGSCRYRNFGDCNRAVTTSSDAAGEVAAGGVHLLQPGDLDAASGRR